MTVNSYGYASALAAEFGVSRQTVWRALRGESNSKKAQWIRHQYHERYGKE